MPDQVLAGKKVAVIVESQYIPEEIRCYQERFASYGAEVHLISYLWGQEQQTFVSEVEVPDRAPETLVVDRDLTNVDLDDYAAVIMSANYTSVRLRWNEEATTSSSPGDAMRQAPGVRFFRNAMLNPRIVKGAPCHALWILTPSPDHLAGRRVTCNPVVLADVRNAGAVYVPAPPGSNWWEHVVVDGDLVTNMSAVHDGEPVGTDRLVDAVRDRIVAVAATPTQPDAEPAHTTGSEPGRRRILVVLSEMGYWGEELVGPLREFDQAGYHVDFCTPNGRRPNAVPVSMDDDFLDPPLQRSVTTREMAARTREIDDPSTVQGKRLQHPISLAGWFPQRPYFASSQFVRRLEKYHRDLEEAAARIEQYDAILLVGGAGAIADLGNNLRVHDLVLSFLASGKPIGAECYAVTCLAFARDMNLRQSILRGKHVTGHCLEYDYQDGTTFVRARNEMFDFNMGPPPFTLEFMLRDATAPDGVYHGNFGRPTSVIVDYPFITARSTPDCVLAGQKMIEVLDGDPPLRRWGW